MSTNSPDVNREGDDSHMADSFPISVDSDPFMTPSVRGVQLATDIEAYRGKLNNCLAKATTLLLHLMVSYEKQTGQKSVTFGGKLYWHSQQDIDEVLSYKSYREVGFEALLTMNRDAQLIIITEAASRIEELLSKLLRSLPSNDLLAFLDRMHRFVISPGPFPIEAAGETFKEVFVTRIRRMEREATTAKEMIDTLKRSCNELSADINQHVTTANAFFITNKMPRFNHLGSKAKLESWIKDGMDILKQHPLDIWHTDPATAQITAGHLAKLAEIIAYNKLDEIAYAVNQVFADGELEDHLDRFLREFTFDDLRSISKEDE